MRFDRSARAGERATTVVSLRTSDIDAVILLPETFQEQIERGDGWAFELEQMLLTRHPTEEIFAAKYEAD